MLEGEILFCNYSPVPSLNVSRTARCTTPQGTDLSRISNNFWFKAAFPDLAQEPQRSTQALQKWAAASAANQFNKTKKCIWLRPWAGKQIFYVVWLKNSKPPWAGSLLLVYSTVLQKQIDRKLLCWIWVWIFWKYLALDHSSIGCGVGACIHDNVFT